MLLTRSPCEVHRRNLRDREPVAAAREREAPATVPATVRTEAKIVADDDMPSTELRDE